MEAESDARHHYDDDDRRMTSPPSPQHKMFVIYLFHIFAFFLLFKFFRLFAFLLLGFAQTENKYILYTHKFLHPPTFFCCLLLFRLFMLLSHSTGEEKKLKKQENVTRIPFSANMWRIINFTIMVSLPFTPLECHNTRRMRAKGKFRCCWRWGRGWGWLVGSAEGMRRLAVNIKTKWAAAAAAATKKLYIYWGVDSSHSLYARLILSPSDTHWDRLRKPTHIVVVSGNFCDLFSVLFAIKMV